MDPDKHRPISVRDLRPPATNVTPGSATAEPGVSGRNGSRPAGRRSRAMKDNRVASVARISPPRDLKLWRTRKLIVAVVVQR